MIQLLNEKYDKLKIYIKYNTYGKYNEEIKDEIISLYASILGYYSAKIDMNYSDNNTEKLQDKIMLQSYDKKLLQKLQIDNLEVLININGESMRTKFNETISFLNKKGTLEKSILNNLKDNYDEAYLVTVLDERHNKLNKKEKNKIYKKHEKSYQMLEKSHLN